MNSRPYIWSAACWLCARQSRRIRSASSCAGCTRALGRQADPRLKKIIFCGEDDAGQTVALQQLLHPPRLDEVAGSSSDELTGYRRSGISALEAQGGGTSHGPLCDRFGWKEIPGVRAQPGTGRGALLRATSVPSARRGWK